MVATEVRPKGQSTSCSGKILPEIDSDRFDRKDPSRAFSLGDPTRTETKVQTKLEICPLLVYTGSCSSTTAGCAAISWTANATATLSTDTGLTVTDACCPNLRPANQPYPRIWRRASWALGSIVNSSGSGPLSPTQMNSPSTSLEIATYSRFARMRRVNVVIANRLRTRDERCAFARLSQGRTRVLAYLGVLTLLALLQLSPGARNASYNGGE